MLSDPRLRAERRREEEEKQAIRQAKKDRKQKILEDKR
jgi:hypothetical protein